MTKQQQLKSLIAKKLSEMTQLQLAYYNKQVDRSEFNTMWVRGQLTNEQHSMIIKQLDAIDELKMIIRQAEQSLISKPVKTSSFSHQQTHHEQHRLFTEQMQRDVQQQQQIHHHHSF